MKLIGHTWFSRTAGAGSGGSGRAALAAALVLCGCAGSYDLTLMPRDSGKLAYGSARDLGNGEASITVALGDKTYTGTWVQVNTERSTSYIGASSWGWQGWGPYGGVEHSVGDAVAKALLQAPDGSGLRCDLYGLTGGQGTGKCVDDKGLVFDVQIRSRNSK
jgi:hypothetical protein